MNRIERLSRTQRKKINRNTKTKIAIALCLALLAMVLINNQWDNFLDVLPDSIVGSYTENEFYSVVDSLFIQIDKEFGFNKHAKLGDTDIPDGVQGAKLYSQPWPRNLPYIFYSQKISKLAQQSGITCKSIESLKNKQLVCILKPERSEFDLSAVIYVAPQRSTKFVEKKIGFILANIGDMNKSDLLRLVDEKVIFSYFADIETFPSGELKNSLEDAGISAIFDLPLDENKLNRFNRTKSGNKKLSQNELAKKILGIHPNTAAINLNRIENYDISFARAILENAGKNKIKYIYNNPPPDVIDSLAYSYGLNIVKYDFNGVNYLNFDELPGVKILNKLINAPGSVEYMMILDIEKMSVNSMISLSKRLRKYGIKQVQGIKLYDSVEML